MNAPGGELLNKDEGHGMKPFDLPSLFLPKKLSEKHFKAACTHTMHPVSYTHLTLPTNREV